MSKLPEFICKGWEDREGPVIFTTVDKNGIPNAIYATSVKIFNEQKIVVADNYFQKTRENISSGCKGSILYMTKEGKSIQLKGPIEYIKSGEIFEDMRKWVDPQLPRHAAAVLNVEEAYSGGVKLM